jgi:Zn-dependent protease with chaperone function
MSWTLLLPALIALVGVALVSQFHRQLPPRAAAWLLMALLIGAGLALLWAAMTVFSGLLAAQPLTDNLFGWCSHIAHRHEHVPLAAGLGGGILLAVMAHGVIRSTRRYRRLRTECSTPLQIVQTAEPIAVTLPGRRPLVLISTGMLACLDTGQQHVVYAHELAHARLRHHRFLLAGDVVASAVPFLRPVANQLGHVIERWADEEAALAVGDRRLVATAIAQAALAIDSHTAGALGMASGSVPDRVRALLAPQRALRSVLAWSGMGCAIAAVVAVASSVQLHHLVTFSQHLC